VLAGGGGERAREIASIAAEAESLAAAVIVGVGSDDLIAACRAAAATRRLPFVACPCGSSRGDRPWRSLTEDG
jgi:glycerol dehydrogenase-like iron-containing ADH family enzyme